MTAMRLHLLLFLALSLAGYKNRNGNNLRLDKQLKLTGTKEARVQ